MIPSSALEMALACTAAEGGLGTVPSLVSGQLVLCSFGEVHTGFQHTLTWATVVQMLAMTGKTQL